MTVASLVLTISVWTTGGWFLRGPAPVTQTPCPGGRILPPGPGDGWGFPNGNPDGYGWVDYGTFLPLGADRTVDYFFPRYYALLPEQLFMPSYYNPYVMRGQRYIAYTGCGGAHPFGGPAPASSVRSPKPYDSQVGAGPVVTPPNISGRVESPPIPSGATGLIP